MMDLGWKFGSDGDMFMPILSSFKPKVLAVCSAIKCGQLVGVSITCSKVDLISSHPIILQVLL